MPQNETLRPSYRVAKFGGTSVQDARAIEQAVSVIAANPNRLVVVLSAMGGVTDLLLKAAETAIKGEVDHEAVETFRRRHVEAAEALIKDEETRARLIHLIEQSADELGSICQSLKTLREHTPRVLDKTMARGERLLAQIVSAVLVERGVKAMYMDATELIQVERTFGSLFPSLKATSARVQDQLIPHLEAGRLVVVPGFIGSGPDDELVTLGRGGSDLSATVLGHALHASEVALYKEVDGLLTADPRYVPEARIVPEMHYREAAELAYYGAKVLHPRTIIPLLPHQIPLVVRNTFHPEQPGTRIAGDVGPGAFPVKALTAILGQSLIAVEGGGMVGVPGVAARTFSALAQANISVSVISQASSEASICFIVPDGEAKAAVRILEDAFRFEIQQKVIEAIRVRADQAVLAVVGLGMKGTPGIAARVFQALARGEVNVEAIAQGSTELNISVVIEQDRVKDALRTLHREFRLEKLRALPHQEDGDVRFAVLGIGQIGRTLLRQVQSQSTYLKDKMSIDLRPIAMADRSGMILQEQGIGPDRVGELLLLKERGGKLASLGTGTTAISALWQLPLRKGIFVDTTADETAPEILTALRAGWHVVVANKKPLAVPQAQYDELFAAARESGVLLRYEATVGAGLPILDTLVKLEEAGDEVHMILGCFSGTLGYLMTELGDGALFSEAVRRAHALGFTEPDPREDLSGMDIARKALILARTLGMKLDLEDLKVEPLFPNGLSHPDPAVFLDNLKQLDGLWEQRIAGARKDGAELRYVARIARTGVTVGVEAVPADSPLGRLRGTDNQVTVSTRRYDKQPLVVSGPGAGAEVTAAGVLTDILAIATAESRGPRREGKPQ